MRVDDRHLHERIGNYVLTKVLGGGAFGTVYLAEHTYLNRTVAIKVLNTGYSYEQKDQDTFFKEAKFLDILQHRHILPIIDAGIQDKMFYLMTEYAPGGSLRERIDHQRPALLPMREALLILSQIGQALHYAHLHNIVHSDLKPENILFNSKGEALLADFGISVQLESGTKDIENIRGSLPYMAPEQFEKKASVKSDQYGLACIAYELFTGERPIKGPIDKNPFVWAFVHKNQVPEVPSRHNPDLSESIDQAILIALAKDHTQRHKDVSTFITSMTSQTSLLAIPDMLTILERELPKEVQQAPEEAPKSIEQWLVEGNNHRINIRLEEALAAYEQALQLGCKDANVYFIKGHILYELKNLEEALAAYEQAIQLMPNKDIFHYRKGNVLRELGYDEDARDAYDKAIEISPHKELFHISKGDVLLAFRDYERAIETYTEAIRLATNNVTRAKAYVGKANTLLRLRNFRGALEAYEKAIALDAKIVSASLYRSKGDAFWMDHQNEKALEAYEQGLKLEPENEILRLKRDAMLDILKKR